MDKSDFVYVIGRIVFFLVFWQGFFWSMYFLQSLLRRVGAKELTEEECKGILKEEFPAYYKQIYYLFAFLFLLLMITYMFIIGIALMNFQKIHFADKSLIMFQGNSEGVFFIPTVFLAIPLAWLTVTMLTLPFTKFNRYQRAQDVLKGWKSRSIYTKELTLALKFTAIMLLIIMPLYFFSFFHYTKVDKNGITYSPFLSLADRVYPWDSVKKIDVSAKAVASDINYRYDLTFADGSKVNLWQRTIDFADDYFWQINPIIKENKIPVNIRPVSQETMNRITAARLDNKTKENIFLILKVSQK